MPKQRMNGGLNGMKSAFLSHISSPQLDAFVHRVKRADVEQPFVCSERLVTSDNLHGDVHQFDLEQYARFLAFRYNPRRTVHFHDVVGAQVLCLNPFSRPYANLCHPKPNSQTVSENAQIFLILRFILLFFIKRCIFSI